MGKSNELRAKLDERGVEYTAYDEEHIKETCWSYMGELTAGFAEYDNGTTRFACDTWCFTPEQAIAATVGAGTCHDLAETPAYRDKTEFKCSECGYEYSAVGGFGCDYGDEPDFNFCPNCGKKVMSE